MSRRYSPCESRCSRSYSSCSDSSEEREYSRHKRFDKFSNEREKYDTLSSSRKRHYSSTSSDYSSSGEPMSKRTNTDQSPHNVNSPGVKLRLETDFPCQISLKVNSASSSQSDASKVLLKPDHQSKTQRRNRNKRQLRKKGEHYEDRQDTLRHKYDTVYSRENERVNMCDDLPKYESRYSREFSRDIMSNQLLKHESRYGREYSRNQYDYLPKHKSSYNQVNFLQDNQEKTKGKKSGKNREKKGFTKYEEDMYHRYDFSRENNRVKVSAFRSSSESDQSEHDKCYRRKDYK
ncbi:hypothetical protein BgiBS90_034277 [Biomphalaria glabrata]|nr:hypothetical protein BgiBS90_038204 [Biomphalaria glabrata]KAI8742776.1 hypothetical protein BgiBS90_034277 [Biomphalaria glabrata]